MANTQKIIKDGEVIILENFNSFSALTDEWRNENFKAESHNYFDGKIKKIENAARLNIISEVESALGIRLDVATVKIRLRVTNKNSPRRIDSNDNGGFIHIDPYDLTGIVYLSDLPEGLLAEDAGTFFYEHKHLKRKQFLTKTMQEKIILHMVLKNDSTRVDQWNVWNKIGFKFKRAAFFSGSLFHSSTPNYFGETDEEGRITMDFFANFKRFD